MQSGAAASAMGGASLLSLGTAVASEAPDGVCGSKLGAGSEVELFADTLALLQVGCSNCVAAAWQRQGLG
jgi:hypothetical protein